MDLDGVLEDLGVEVEGLDGAAVGFLGVVACLLVVEGGGFFLGGSLGIFFFCSGIVDRRVIVQHEDIRVRY